MRQTHSAFGLTALAGDLAIAALCLYGAFLVRTRVALPGTEVDWRRRSVRANGRETLVRAYPISVDADEFDGLVASPLSRAMS